MRASLLLALVLFLAAPLAAQPRVVLQNDRALTEALRGLGVAPDAPAVAAAVPEAFAAVYPNERYDRYRLSAIQALAVAHIAVVYAAQHRAAPYPGTPYPGTPSGYACADATEALYELSAQIPEANNLFLSDREKQTLRSGAADVRRAASACGCAELAESALALEQFAGSMMPHRRAAIDRLRAMREQAAACR